MKPQYLLKTILALALFVCLFHMPYSYYQMVRFLSSVGFGYFAFQAYQEHKNNLALVFTVLLVLFQPLMEISLERELWNIVDVLVGLFLIVVALTEKSKTKLAKCNNSFPNANYPIRIEKTVLTYNSITAIQGLANHNPIKWVAVVKWQIAQNNTIISFN